MKKIGIIGIGGVGMAHCVAAVRSGNEVTVIIDKNEKILKNSKNNWKNEWNDVIEEVKPNNSCIYLNDINDLNPLLHLDLIIIATPPNTHYTIIKQCLTKNIDKIIVEKPIDVDGSININDLALTVSTEWIYHSGLKNVTILNSLQMHFTMSKKTNWGYYLPAIYDFGPHLISIIIDKGYVIKDFKFSKINKDNFEGIIFTDKNDIKIFGTRDNNNGLIVNDKILDWELDLFDKQINSKQYLQWKTLQKYHKKLVDSLSLEN